MKDTKKTDKAYVFLTDKESQNIDFSNNEMAQYVGWSNSTVKTYCQKQYKKFTTYNKRERKYRCEGLAAISLDDFRKLSNQGEKFEPECLRIKNQKEENINVYKARHFALLAISIYNNPFAEFRVYGYIVNIVIAWTALLHAIFDKQDLKYFYTDKDNQIMTIDGENKAWELGACISPYFKNTNLAIQENLKRLIGLRNKIEHNGLPYIENLVAGLCQACLINFEKIIIKEFGKDYALGSGLAIALQLTHYNEAQVHAMKILQSEQYNEIKKWMDAYDQSLSDEILQSQEYRISLFLIPKLSNRETSADVSMEFIKFDPNDPNSQESHSKIIAAIKEKITEIHKHRFSAGEVRKEVAEKLGKNFSQHNHTQAWKKYEVRPQETESLNTQEKHVKWVKLGTSKQYLYTQDWIDFLVRELKDDTKYQNLISFKIRKIF